jgi:hypothetical protein
VTPLKFRGRKTNTPESWRAGQPSRLRLHRPVGTAGSSAIGLFTAAAGFGCSVAGPWAGESARKGGLPVLPAARVRTVGTSVKRAWPEKSRQPSGSIRPFGPGSIPSSRVHSHMRPCPVHVPRPANSWNSTL